ncbi:MAG: alginate lyase family protein [Bacteroidales bacterium]|nr:alginate lyase family protein [Bacteroidales bacterium]
MSGPEIIYRLRQWLRQKAEKTILSFFVPQGKLLSVSEIFDIEVPAGDGEYRPVLEIFGKEFNYLEEKPDWHRDIFSGESFSTGFSKEINIRINPRASAKNVWEINRLHFLLPLAIQYRRTGDRSYLIMLIDLLESWIDENPYLRGINWYSNIEVNIRLINWFFCWHIIKAGNLMEEDERFRVFALERWIPSVYQHCYYSYKNPSKYSSANNHLVSEYAGLYMASSLWKFSESDKWLRLSARGLEREISLQHSSGINREEAAEYIQFITDFFLLTYVTADRSGQPFSENYRNELKKIFRYIFNFLDMEGNFPDYGDNDEGKVFRVNPAGEENNFRSLLSSATVLFREPEFKSKSIGYDLKNYLLFGEKGKEIFGSVADIQSTESSVFYSDEGHFIFRDGLGSHEIYLHFNAAALGYLSIAAHGHADALSFVLNINGKPFITDQGTYTYHTDMEWRKYFIGTLAHNTIRINRKDQALNAGPTLWLKHYKTFITDINKDDDNESVEAYHNGYMNEGVIHYRRITFNRRAKEFVIKDRIILSRKAEAMAEIPFHFHPRLRVEHDGPKTYRISDEHGRGLFLSIDPKLKTSVVCGQEKPEKIGWYSGSFLNKEPSSVVYSNCKLTTTTEYEHKIKII